MPLDLTPETIALIITSVVGTLGAVKGKQAYENSRAKKNGNGLHQYPPHYKVMTTDHHEKLCSDRLKPLHDDVKDISKRMDDGFRELRTDVKEILRGK